MPSLQRDNDRYIMTDIIQSGKFSPDEIRRINYCRLFLQAYTLSDITTAQGTRIDPGAINGNLQEMSSRSKLLPVHQEKPNEASWKLWRECLKIWAVQSTLLVPLGNWKHTAPLLRRKWKSYYDPNTKSLFQHHQHDQFHQYTHKREQFYHHAFAITSPVLSHWIPVTTTNFTTSTIFLCSPIWTVPIPIAQTIAETFQEYLLQQPQWEQDLLWACTLFYPPYEYLEKIETAKETAIDIHLPAVSDGSVLPEKMWTGKKL